VNSVSENKCGNNHTENIQLNVKQSHQSHCDKPCNGYRDKADKHQFQSSEEIPQNQNNRYKRIIYQSVKIGFEMSEKGFVELFSVDDKHFFFLFGNGFYKLGSFVIINFHYRSNGKQSVFFACEFLRKKSRDF